MKKLLLLISVLLVGLEANAQFKATPIGVATEDGKDFYVVEIPNKSASELFNSATSYVLSKFKNPNEVMSKIDNKMLTIHGVYPQAVYARKTLIKIFADVNMNLVLHFKDNKVRFDIPIINSMYYNVDDEVKFSGGVSVMGDGDVNMFKKNGKVSKQQVIDSFNAFINGEIAEIVEYLKGTKENKDDW